MTSLPPSSWTAEMAAAADSEGWRLSERSDGYYGIERYDEDPEGRFADDDQALAFVSEKARGGSYMHQVALHLDETPFRAGAARGD